MQLLARQGGDVRGHTLAAVLGAAGNVLAVHQVARVSLAQVICHGRLVFAYARFVAERPHDNRGVVLVALVHTGNAIKQRLAPLLAIGKVIPVAYPDRAVRFVIGLVDHVKAELVAKPVKARVVRVVTGADGIDVVAFEKQKILGHMIHRCGRTEVRMAVVAVDTLCLHFFAVDQDGALDHAHVTEAYEQANVLVACGQQEAIQIRRFVAPEQRSVDRKRKLSLTLHLRLATVYLAAVRCFQAVGYAAAALGEQRDLGTGCAKVVGKVRAHVNILDVRGVSCQKIDLTEQTRETELVLILKIRAVAPFQHHHGNRVGACLQVGCHVKFAGHMADLAVSDEGVVDKEIKAGIHTLKIEVKALGSQGLGANLKVSDVKATGCIIGHEGRVKGKGI